MTCAVYPWRAFAAELVGTALLVAGGLSIVIVDNGDGIPILRFIPEPGLRRSITGFLFGTVGALIALSPLGKASGAHINPVVTLGFFLADKLRADHAAGYLVYRFGLLKNLGIEVAKLYHFQDDRETVFHSPRGMIESQASDNAGAPVT
jgi:Major intrinsic protein